MLGDGRACLGDHGFQLLLIRLGQGAQLRHDHLIDEIEDAGVLFDGCLGMDARNTKWIEHFAHL